MMCVLCVHMWIFSCVFLSENSPSLASVCLVIFVKSSRSEKVSSWGQCEGWPIQITDYRAHAHTFKAERSIWFPGSPWPTAVKNTGHTGGDWWASIFRSPVHLSASQQETAVLLMRNEERQRGHKLSEFNCGVKTNERRGGNRKDEKERR